MLGEKSFDAVIIDLESDVEYALELVEFVASTTSTTVMVYTSRLDPNVMVRSMRAGAREFLSDPIDPNALSTGQPAPDSGYDSSAPDDGQFYERSDQAPSSTQQPYGNSNPAAGGSAQATYGQTGYVPLSSGPNYAEPDSFDDSGMNSAYSLAPANPNAYTPASSRMDNGGG